MPHDSSILAYIAPKLEIRVSTDASKEGLGTVLLQKHEDDWKPVAYATRSLPSCKTRYAHIEKACLAFGCAKFRSYINGLANVTLETDHTPLVSFAEKILNDMTPRLQRLMLKLQR